MIKAKQDLKFKGVKLNWWDSCLTIQSPSEKCENSQFLE